MISPALPLSTVSLVIPVYNGGASFRACLASVLQTRPQPLELIVVADDDTDGSGAFAQASGARVMTLPVRGGPARARNIGARAARGDLVFLSTQTLPFRLKPLHRSLRIFIPIQTSSRCLAPMMTHQQQRISCHNTRTSCITIYIKHRVMKR